MNNLGPAVPVTEIAWKATLGSNWGKTGKRWSVPVGFHLAAQRVNYRKKLLLATYAVTSQGKTTFQEWQGRFTFALWDISHPSQTVAKTAK